MNSLEYKEKIYTFIDDILSHLPDGREKSIVKTHFETGALWACNAFVEKDHESPVTGYFLNITFKERDYPYIDEFGIEHATDNIKIDRLGVCEAREPSCLFESISEAEDFYQKGFSKRLKDSVQLARVCFSVIGSEHVENNNEIEGMSLSRKKLDDLIQGRK